MREKEENTKFQHDADDYVEEYLHNIFSCVFSMKKKVANAIFLNVKQKVLAGWAVYEVYYIACHGSSPSYL